MIKLKNYTMIILKHLKRFVNYGFEKVPQPWY